MTFLFVAALALGALSQGACEFRPLSVWQADDQTPAPTVQSPDAQVAMTADAPVDLMVQARLDAPLAAPDAAALSPTVRNMIAGCTPSEEVCNGRDDDCDGQIDEALAAVPCPTGGQRFCVAGKLSECPRRCAVCVPGSRRVCMVSYCDFWGEQTCAADGQAFGFCKEQKAPPECVAIARDKKRSRELEQCCLDAGYCCRDEFDLDKDGDTNEMLGRCNDVRCDP